MMSGVHMITVCSESLSATEGGYCTAGTRGQEAGCKQILSTYRSTVAQRMPLFTTRFFLSKVQAPLQFVTKYKIKCMQWMYVHKHLKTNHVKNKNVNVHFSKGCVHCGSAVRVLPVEIISYSFYSAHLRILKSLLFTNIYLSKSHLCKQFAPSSLV